MVFIYIHSLNLINTFQDLSCHIYMSWIPIWNCLSAWYFVCVFSFLTVCLFVCLYFFWNIWLSICLRAVLFNLSVFILFSSICLLLFIGLRVCCPFIFLSVSLSFVHLAWCTKCWWQTHKKCQLISWHLILFAEFDSDQSMV